MLAGIAAIQSPLLTITSSPTTSNDDNNNNSLKDESNESISSDDKSSILSEKELWNTTELGIFKVQRTQKNKPCLLLDGHRYKQRRTNLDGSVSWTCTHELCSASVRTYQDRVVRRNDDHLHDRIVRIDPGHEFLARLKKRAYEDTLTIPRIYDEEVQYSINKHGKDIEKQLPTFSSVKSTLYRHRQKKQKPQVQNSQTTHPLNVSNRTLTSSPTIMSSLPLKKRFKANNLTVSVDQTFTSSTSKNLQPNISPSDKGHKLVYPQCSPTIWQQQQQMHNTSINNNNYHYNNTQQNILLNQNQQQLDMSNIFPSAYQYFCFQNYLAAKMNENSQGQNLTLFNTLKANNLTEQIQQLQAFQTFQMKIHLKNEAAKICHQTQEEYCQTLYNTNLSPVVNLRYDNKRNHGETDDDIEETSLIIDERQQYDEYENQSSTVKKRLSFSDVMIQQQSALRERCSNTAMLPLDLSVVKVQKQEAD
ncbi:unnamed protein product [Didymodactylos carnosus]|uniref:FLYWCH-type domain-containing protein n=1 Tax=Didymodactylos carnosus TaxID=1234261 RepID=A0A814EHL0_9BILA|nr:unnamed protein product [Didymodactylos carnosus]CAF1192738.1 unnamed protein product [Didymodactylos carnosus]CAF3742344.1 unnamed protein product [Didymodactylos carnosus]CAF4003010.1 unnamed protein product [Didymodactylos carnosus]